MTDNGDWTIAVGCRKAAVQIAIRLPLALATCWGGFWLLRTFTSWMATEMNRRTTLVDDGLILVIAVVAGWIAGQILSRKLSEGTGLFGNPLLLATCIPFIAGLWMLQQFVASTAPFWTDISLYQFSLIGIVTCIVAWRQFGMDS
jgi:uncharacterized membrane protein YeaQ/YmgE (transglycosylase-associated protein family)